MEDLEVVVSRAAEIGVKQITASTMKPVSGFFSSLRKGNPELFRRLIKIYSEGEWISGYKYLNRCRRLKILERLRAITLNYGLEFSTCREGFPHLSTTICDGTAFCRELLSRFMA
jgi:DNA repair photolyase